MPADIIQLRDYQNKRDLERLYGEGTLEQQAIGIVDFINGLTSIDTTQANSNHSILYNGEGIDGMLPKEPA